MRKIKIALIGVLILVSLSAFAPNVQQRIRELIVLRLRVTGLSTFGNDSEYEGNKIDLDLDNDTSITADTDDQIDVEIGGADEFVFAADELDATNGQIVNIGAAGTDFDTSGGLTLATGITLSSGFETITAQTAISVTDGSIITPTGSYQPLESAGSVTATLSSGCTDGQALELENTTSTSIVISETVAVSRIAGNMTMGIGDTMTLRCDGTRWIERARSNN